MTQFSKAFKVALAVYLIITVLLAAYVLIFDDSTENMQGTAMVAASAGKLQAPPIEILPVGILMFGFAFYLIKYEQKNKIHGSYNWK